MEASEVRSAERAVYDRMALACAAARQAGLPGEFRSWESSGLLAVIVTDPALAFLATISGITASNTDAAIEHARALQRGGDAPAIVTSGGADAMVEERLRRAGLNRTVDGVLAVRRLDGVLDSVGWEPERCVMNAAEGESASAFIQILLAGYETDAAVAAFIEAEHRSVRVQRFLLMGVATPVAAAAMTIHGEVAVLGGAATLRARRGQGAQTRLLRHRLHIAAAAGCRLAVATARAGSASAANLERAGFCLVQRSMWRFAD